jgi:GTP-binding protein LepA
LEAIVQQVPPPKGDPEEPLQALIFDSHYDPYKGVVAYVRVFHGRISATDTLRLMATGSELKPVEVGIFAPDLRPARELSVGEVGYVATGLKTVRECRVGDTFTNVARPAPAPLPGYRKVKPMVFAGIYPVEGEDYGNLKDALEKLQLNDASLVYQPETSQALNFGFRCGFLGMFHMDIIQERLEREYDLDIIVPPLQWNTRWFCVAETIRIDSPAELPEEGDIAEVREPWMKIEIFSPTEFYGPIMEMTTKRRGIFVDQEYPAPNRVQLNFEIPLSELIVDFFDQLKSRTRGYASLDYQFLEYRPDDLVKLEILVNDEPVDALATIVHRDHAYHKGQAIISKLKDLIPRQLFVVPIQAYAAGRGISGPMVRRGARTCWPSATAGISPARKSCSKSRSGASGA